MAATFPHRYEAQLEWKNGRESLLMVETSAGKRQLVAGPPPQFDGKESFWSPEDLLLSSIQLCLVSTFLAIAEKAAFPFRSLQTRIVGILEKTAEGIVFTSIRLSIQIDTEQLEKARELFAKAKKHCIVSNAVKVAVELEVNAR